MTPEAKAREVIDAKLAEAGWQVQDLRGLNLGAARGVAVREFPTDSGPADYVLFVDRQPAGVIEAKRDEAGQNITIAEGQTARYAGAVLKWRVGTAALPFLFQSTAQLIRFTDGRDPVPRSREIFHFFRPEQLARWLAEPDTLRRRLAERMPPLPTENLRGCQVDAVTGLERSLAENRPRALVHMATGAGKTFTAITSVYRLLKFGGASRILFLVDTRNLGKQAHQEFMAYTPPDDARRFTELYNVQRLAGGSVDPQAQVCISTIQRMYSMLSGEPIDESAEDVSLNELQTVARQPRPVRYNPALPVETFDFIVIDECHRSIYNLWKQVLDYFDAFLIGLTATPDQRTYGFFNQNVVAEYSYEQSVADLVNVGYDVYEIETEITKKGAEVKAREWVDHRERETRKRRWAQTEDDTPYDAKALDRSVVNPSQIRQVIKAMKTAVETQIFPTRKETPKTLIFAKTDSHADDIINILREVYAQGNAFCRKITYRSEDDTDSTLASFRNDHHPRIAVTVDMIATGTDVKPLEVLLFMRDVRSRGYYEQMKGRGVRSLGHDDLKRVSNSADSAKTRFVLIDAVGVERSLKTESRPLEKKPGVPLASLLQGVAMGLRDEDTVLSLASRLLRLARQLDAKALARIEQASGGVPVADLGKALVAALDADRIAEAALAAAHAKGISRVRGRPRHRRTRRRPRRAPGGRLRAVRPPGAARRHRAGTPRARAADRPHQPRPADLLGLRRAGRGRRPAGRGTLRRLPRPPPRRDRRARLLPPAAVPAPGAHLRDGRGTAREARRAAADADHRAAVERLCPRAGVAGEGGGHSPPAHRPGGAGALRARPRRRTEALRRPGGPALPGMDLPPQRAAPDRLHARADRVAAPDEGPHRGELQHRAGRFRLRGVREEGRVAEGVEGVREGTGRGDGRDE